MSLIQSSACCFFPSASFHSTYTSTIWPLAAVYSGSNFTGEPGFSPAASSPA